MAISVYKNRFCPEQGRWIKDYIMDGSSDAANLPTLSNQVGAGSRAHYVADGEIVGYELAPAGTWKLVTGGGFDEGGEEEESNG